MNNIIKQEFSLTKTLREERNGHKAIVIWFTGLSGSGKSTLANTLELELFKRDIYSFVLDGDNTRLGINKDLDFTELGRKENIRRVAEIAKLMTDAGIVTITSFVSPFSKERENAKEIIGRDNIIEIYVKCPIEVCEKRDVKGLYKKAKKGEITNFTGISSPYEEPLIPNIIIDTSILSLEKSLEKILTHVIHKLKK